MPTIMRLISVLAFAAAIGTAMLASSASARECSGTYIRRSCMMGATAGYCGYPREKGTREDFMGWEIQDGERGYAVYRLGVYPAKDIRLDPGCRLGKY
jgi:hypothetical protein